MKQYDAIIIGFGKGGKLLAAELANRNWKVAIIERSPQMYGGTCVNVGCIPTKALIYESEQAERLYRDDYGNQAKYYALAIRRKNKLVSFLRDKNHERIKEHPNITLYDGTASFVSDDTVKVVSHNKKEILLKGKEVFINTGATPILPAVKGIDASKHVFTSETLLQQSKFPGTCSFSAPALSEWSLPPCMRGLEAKSRYWKRAAALCPKPTGTLRNPC